MALIHHLDARDFAAGLQLWHDHAASFEADCRMLQNLAGIHAGLGRWLEALRCVVDSAAVHDNPADLLMDHDLLSLWEHLAGKNSLSPAAAHLLGSPSVARICDVAELGELLRSITRNAVMEALPEPIRPWMRRGLSSLFSWRPTVRPHSGRPIMAGSLNSATANSRCCARLVQRPLDHL